MSSNTLSKVLEELWTLTQES